jgi:hypothetical protein
MGNKPNSLAPQSADYLAAALKAILGAVPLAGSLLVELAENVIPNQRIDRVTKFVKILEKKIAHLEEVFVHSQLADESFTDLLEEALRQSVRSLTPERREYLANIVANSLSDEEIKFAESKHMLRLLGELNDIEIIWLKFYLEIPEDGGEQFMNEHQEILSPVIATHEGPPSAIVKETLQNSYQEHLARLGLLKPKYGTDMRTKLPEYDSYTGAQKIVGYEISWLGRLLLRQIGLSNKEEQNW